MEPSSHAIARFIVSPSRPSSAIPTRLGKRAGSKTPSAACAASFRAKPISQRSKTNASILSSVPTITLHENALTSELQPRPSAKCCTSNVNPAPRFRGDDRGVWLEIECHLESEFIPALAALEDRGEQVVEGEFLLAQA